MSITSVQPNQEENTVSVSITALDYSLEPIPIEISIESIIHASINIARESGLDGDFEIALGTGQVFKIDHEDYVFKMVDLESRLS